MKHTLLFAGMVTLFFAILLVWMDNALEQYINPATKKSQPIIVLPEREISPSPAQIPNLPLPEVLITARKCKGKLHS
jgi:hypothetical protein